ncbi:Mrp/NBP35 family ATP-binding protein [Parafannyhessea umbonata]|uniref:Mrp/NBP35 family ATP-binding protein n=1 Tax=Parafannyhessea umbonata TaxID=604330 RepID=UPI0026E9AB50|nr:Mrp/NBP35 family ATP-binding protein [Parafannyhessea umbonata]MCI6681687.1 Mrp/NBP35 family ATP-binding protein [Parafannyhessea umbonata]MCI7219463.1 Mrp/NBP35 family ATP-binding protein [Parafannyhessea umbonata]
MAENDIDRDAIKDEVDQIFGNRPKHEGPELYQVNDQSSIKHVIGVISGKGGVGKSLVTGILATELARKGHKVGILDADITGPSIPKMFGLSGLHVFGQGDKIIPAQSKGGIKIMSTNLVLENENDPVLWRGPMLMGALKQFYEDTLWGDIDYLLVDMPPGTGDVALAVFQSLPIEGVVIVSSPQDLVQVIVGKAVKMAAMMNVPVLGVVENMSYMECPECGHKLEPFGPSHLQEIVDEFKVADLGRIPIDPKVAASCDAGTFESELPEGLIPKAVSAVEA